MVSDTIQLKHRRKVEQVNFYLFPDEKVQVVKQAKKENRSVSNFIKTKVMEAINK